MRTPRFLPVLCVLFLLQLLGSVYAGGVDSTWLENVKVDPNGLQKGIKGISISFDLRFARSEEGEIPIFKEDPGPFLIRAFVTDPNGLNLNGTDDAPNYRNQKSYCRDSIRVMLPEKGIVVPQLQLFIPFYAIDLRSGTYDLQVRIQMRESGNEQLVQELAPVAIKIEKPPLKLMRLSVKYFKVDSSDFSGGNWDYHLLNEDESRPDPEWKLMRGRFAVYKPRRLKNTFEYAGGSMDLTPLFTLSEGDLLELVIEDFDLTSYSDQIGNTTVNPWRPDFPFSTYQKRDFGKVKDFTFSLFGFYLPDLEIGNIRSTAPHQYEGVTGTSVSFDFKVTGRPDASKFFIELMHSIGAAEETPRFVRVVSGPGHVDAESHLIMDADQGTIELFIPHYGMSSTSGGVPGFLAIFARIRMEGQNYTLVQRLKRLNNPLVDELKEVQFRSYSVDMDKKGAHAGFRVVCELNMPELYFSDIPDREYRFRPGVLFPSGPIDPTWIEYADDAPGKLSGSELLLDISPGPKVVEMFIPAYHFEELPKDKFQVKLNAVVRMGREAEELVVGTAETSMEIVVPEPDSIWVRVPELTSKKYPWMDGGANLQWRLRSGDVVLFESPIMYRDYSPVWAPDLRAFLVFYGAVDDIRLEILHYGNGGIEHLLGVLKRGSEEWPLKEAGKVSTEIYRTKVKMPGLKKCVIEVKR